MSPRLLLAAATAAMLAGTLPAGAQSPAADARFRAAQERFDREYQIYREEADRFLAARDVGYRSAPMPEPRVPYPATRGYADDVYDDADGYGSEEDYDAARHYRAGPQYQERVLATDDRVYRGNDGRYYCRRSDGTTGLIVGAAAGGILGNVIDGGRSRIVGTLLGGAAGALAGRAVDQNQSEIRCR